MVCVFARECQQKLSTSTFLMWHSTAGADCQTSLQDLAADLLSVLAGPRAADAAGGGIAAPRLPPISLPVAVGIGET